MTKQAADIDDRADQAQLTTLAHELICHVDIARRRAGLRANESVILGFATETADGGPRSAIGAHRAEIAKAVNAQEMRWIDKAWRTCVIVDGEELLISLQPVVARGAN